MPSTPNPIDLTTVAAVQAWLGVNQVQGATGFDQNIQNVLTSCSLAWIRETARGPMDGSIPETNPLKTTVDYDEWYDGNGNVLLFLRNWPIVSVSVVTVDGCPVTASSSPRNPGYVIGGSGRYLALRYVAFPAGWMRGAYSRIGGVCGWSRGIQNVNVQYTAGFSAIPPDVADAVTREVGLHFKRRSWIGQKSQSLSGGAGTVVYDAAIRDQYCQKVLDSYQRGSQ